LILAGGGVVALLAIGIAMRPKPQPTPVPQSMSPVASQGGPTQSQGQVEAPVSVPPAPAPADSQQPQDKKKTTPAATAQQTPAQPAAVLAGSPLTIPAGTRITVRTIGMASTRSSKLGDHIAASIDAPVVVAGRTAIARGADASLRVASLEDGIVLDLATVTVGGRRYNASAGEYSAPSAGKEKKGNKVVRGLRHLDPLHRGGDQATAQVVSPDSRLTFTLSRALEVVAP
jgi:hypothetical protein